jgi:hypothetical protein
VQGKYIHAQRQDVPKNHPLYRDDLVEQRRQPVAYINPLQTAYLQNRKVPMEDQVTDIHSLEQFRLQKEMARLRAAKNQQLRWREAPIDSYQRTTSCPSIYGPLALFHTENHSIRLVPQPTVSPEDPLNWPWWKKHAVLAAMIPGCLLSDWTLTWGTTVFELQAPEWYVMHYPDDANDTRQVT